MAVGVIWEEAPSEPGIQESGAITATLNPAVIKDPLHIAQGSNDVAIVYSFGNFKFNLALFL